MEIRDTGFRDLWVIDYFSFTDQRGEFVKTIHETTFKDVGMEWIYPESFYSLSYKNVIRGMHFQYPPHEHAKLVYVVYGQIRDVVLDLRNEEATFGKYFSIELSAEKRNAIYIGKGFAHGFLSTVDHSVVEYHTTTMQSKQSEGGIKWNSFGFDWNIESPIISNRDNSFDDFDKKAKYFI